MTMTAPSLEQTEQDEDDDGLAHIVRMKTAPQLGKMYQALCGVWKVYSGPRLGAPMCGVCERIQKSVHRSVLN